MANERKMRHKFRNLQLCPELPNHLLVSSSLRVEQGDLGERVGDVKLRSEATSTHHQVQRRAAMLQLRLCYFYLLPNR